MVGGSDTILVIMPLLRISFFYRFLLIETKKVLLPAKPAMLVTINNDKVRLFIVPNAVQTQLTIFGQIKLHLT